MRLTLNRTAWRVLWRNLGGTEKFRLEREEIATACQATDSEQIAVELDTENARILLQFRQGMERGPADWMEMQVSAAIRL